jgi:transposase
VVSRQTILRLVRRYPEPSAVSVRRVGIDDWAYTKGQRYGTILIDLDEHRVIDLLPDATSQTVAAWLEAHPEIEVVSRDRSRTYAEASDKGAPQAQQVADRWHLVKNLWEAIKLDYTRQIKQLRQLVLVRDVPVEPIDPAIIATFPAAKPINRSRRPPSAEVLARQARREHWEHVHRQVHELVAAGYTWRKIARTLHISRTTVSKYAALEDLPVRTAVRSTPRLMDAHWDYLKERLLQQGHIPARKLWVDLQARGFTGSLSTVQHELIRMRRELGLPSPAFFPKPPPPRLTQVTPSQLATWVCSPSLAPDQQELLDQACALHEIIDLVTQLARDFLWILRQQKSHHLLPWIEAVLMTDIPALKRFAEGLLPDFDAVLAACQLPWSNGQVEGQINRLKFIKR